MSIKYLYPILFLSSFICKYPVSAQSCSHDFKVVVLGSSTSAGAGASPSDSAYVNLFRTYLMDSVNTGCEVINLAKGGYNSRKIQPAWYGGDVDTARNIDKALSYLPDAILINLPSNDAAGNFSLIEQQDNFLRVTATADSAQVPVWVTTTQPRNFPDPSKRDSLKAMKDWIILHYPDTYIDFWTGVAEIDGSIQPVYNSGDGVHLNNAGHHLLFERVIGSNLIDSLCMDEDPPPTAISGVDEQMPRIYANGNTLNIRPPKGTTFSFRIFDINGRQINYKYHQTQTFRQSFQTKGIYLVRYYNEQTNKVIHRKVVIADYSTK